MKPRIAILTGYGINSDVELAQAFNLAGGDAVRVHLHDAIDGRVKLDDFAILAVPGGFSFGDHIASGRVFANRLRHKLGDTLLRLREKKVPMLGICNGFQVLVKLGLLPGTEPASFTQTCTLTFNDSGRFENRWCHLAADAKNPSLWLKGVESIYLPVRHGEGKFIPGSEALLKELQANGQACLRYRNEDGSVPEGFPANPNGSTDDIAGLCSKDGLVFGLMPHPEAHILPTQHPHWQRDGMKAEGDGLAIFRNAVHAVR
ncbi:MAG TPA: phosphoribosylformylglycinamidine synthase subunit PurQ [Fibrobacteria bacterium]|jgi:phosphoribosylformylglycinamidine synthase|nr:phosphoribosylformylglycinamidine synthase subunit PurQ [Fibrobacteria bacterium]